MTTRAIGALRRLSRAAGTSRAGAHATAQLRPHPKSTFPRRASRGVAPPRAVAASDVSWGGFSGASSLARRRAFHAAGGARDNAGSGTRVPRVVAGGGGDLDTSEERIQDLELSVEAEQSYLAYAMSVIVGRALPDVRDGLKPVHRRILFAMHELGLDSKKPFKKCARVVGEVLGKFHPHGDQSVYDALVRMAQDFSMSAQLVDGHGNFGSLDADPPAAMRYTECRLRGFAEAMLLADIDADAVDFAETFDGSQTEPSVLPARLPNLLINGSTGIAVGMATSIPPHNMREVAAALKAYASDPENCSLDDVLAVMPAPDFPTGGEIVFPEGGFREMYRTGRGGVTLRGVTSIETVKTGSGARGSTREAVVISSIPYQTNKAALCEQIADLVNSRAIEGVADVRDESDRDGMRVVIELRRSADAEFTREQLYARTKLQTRVSVNVVGLVGREPKVLSLMDVLREFLEFRKDAVARRARFALDKTSARLHIVEGYLAVQAAPDAVVAAIRAAPDSKTAAAALREKPFWLSDKQAEATLAMPLRRLTGLEREKLNAEEAELSAKVADLTDLLADPSRVIATVIEEAERLSDAYGVDRRTRIDTAAADDAAARRAETGDGLDDRLAGLGGSESERAREAARLFAKRHNKTLESLNADALVIMTQRGYIKRIDPKTFSKQNRATRGKTMGKMRGGDEVTKATHCAGLDTVLFFTDRGRVHAVRAYTIPEASTTALGTPFTRVLKLAEGESITAMLPVSSADEAEAGGTDEPHLVMVTARGLIKKTCASEFVSIRNNGKKALLLRAGDRLKHVGTVREGDGILVGGIDGQVIHFDGDSIRPQGRAAAGVKAMAFKADAKKAAVSEKTLGEEEDDAGDALPANVAGMVVVPSATVKALELDKASAAAAAGSSSPEGDEELEELACDPETDAKCAEGPMLMLLSASGRGKRISLSAFKQQTRAGRGKRGMGLLKGDAVAAMCVTGFDGARGENVIVGSQNGVMNRYDVDSIRPQSGTAAKGVTLMKLGEGDTVSVLTLLPAELAEENERTE